MLKFWFNRHANTFDQALLMIVVLVAQSDNTILAVLIAFAGGVASRQGEKALAWEKEHCQ